MTKKIYFYHSQRSSMFFILLIIFHITAIYDYASLGKLHEMFIFILCSYENSLSIYACMHMYVRM